jgi:hypothetical protein
MEICGHSALVYFLALALALPSPLLSLLLDPCDPCRLSSWLRLILRLILVAGVRHVKIAVSTPSASPTGTWRKLQDGISPS